MRLGIWAPLPHTIRPEPETTKALEELGEHGVGLPQDRSFRLVADTVLRAEELGFDITLPQRRAVVMKAGTDPAKVKVISDALAKVAASAEYKAYLQEQYATDDSYFAAQDAAKIMEEDLAQMKRYAEQTAGKK